MSKMRLVALVGAVVCALAAGMMAKNMINRPANPEPAQAAQKVETVDVLIAVKDIQMGDRLGGTIDWKAWPKENLTESMITREAKPDAVKDLVLARARIVMFQGEPVTTKKVLMPNDAGFMASALPKGMRAEAVSISTKSSAGGFILPNDRVDVILVKKFTVPGKAEQGVRSETVISNVRVLAINQVFKQAVENDPVSVEKAETATLELTPRQAEILAMVESSGEISLALRSIAENDGKNNDQIAPVLASKYTDNKEKQETSNGPLFVRAGIQSYATAQ